MSASQDRAPGPSTAEFEALYEHEYLRLKRTLIGILGSSEQAEDCVQEAFVSAFRAWPSWRRDAPAGAWLHRIAVNTALAYRRRERLRSLKSQLAGGRTAEAAADSGAGEWDITACLRKLSGKQAAAIVLRHYHGYTIREVAEILGISERGAAFRLSRAHQALRECLDHHAPAPPGDGT